MLENINKFQEFDSAVRAFYDTEQLDDIGSVTFGDFNSVSFFSDVVRRKQNLKPFPYSDFKIYDELHFISKDIKYYIALLYFFKPYITDCSNGTYFQNVEDRRYMMYASIGFQSIYNFWDRIGDLLNLFLKTGLPDTSVYYARVLHNFPAQYKSSEHYIWLNNSFTNEVKSFLGQRDEIVHSYQLECEYYWKVIEASGNIETSQGIQAERELFPDKFKKQMQLAREGFIRTLKLINELPDKEEMLENEILP